MIKQVIEDIKKIIKNQAKDENPWEHKPEPKKTITKNEIKEAVEKMNLPKPSNPYKLILIQGFTILWILGHFGLLYVGIGTPISAGVLIYVLINFFLFSHYLILLRGTKNDIQPKN